MPEQERKEELRNRLLFHFIGKFETSQAHNQFEEILTKQVEIETALREDGYPQESLLAKRHEIRTYSL